MPEILQHSTEKLFSFEYTLELKAGGEETRQEVADFYNKYWSKESKIIAPELDEVNVMILRDESDDIIATRSFTEDGRLCLMLVSPEWRGQGIGTTMTVQAAKMIREKKPNQTLLAYLASEGDGFSKKVAHQIAPVEIHDLRGTY